MHLTTFHHSIYLIFANQYAQSRNITISLCVCVCTCVCVAQSGCGNYIVCPFSIGSLCGCVRYLLYTDIHDEKHLFALFRFYLFRRFAIVAEMLRNDFYAFANIHCLLNDVIRLKAHQSLFSVPPVSPSLRIMCVCCVELCYPKF